MNHLMDVNTGYRVHGINTRAYSNRYNINDGIYMSLLAAPTSKSVHSRSHKTHCVHLTNEENIIAFNQPFTTGFLVPTVHHHQLILDRINTSLSHLQSTSTSSTR